MSFYFIPLTNDCGGAGTYRGGSGGGGASIVTVEKKIPKVKIKLVKDEDYHSNINITVLKVIDLSLNIGGKEC